MENLVVEIIRVGPSQNRDLIEEQENFFTRVGCIQSNYFIALLNDRPISYVSWEETVKNNKIVIHQICLYTDDSFRNRGLSKLLCEKLIKYLNRKFKIPGYLLSALVISNKGMRLMDYLVSLSCNYSKNNSFVVDFRSSESYKPRSIKRVETSL